MALKAAHWIHGTIVEVEDPTTTAQIVRMGDGAHIFGQPATGGWFHFPITTPVILDDVRPPLVKVFVFFRADDSVTITNVHVFDGPTRVKAFDGLQLQGDHSRGI